MIHHGRAEAGPYAVGGGIMREDNRFSIALEARGVCLDLAHTYVLY